MPRRIECAGLKIDAASTPGAHPPAGPTLDGVVVYVAPPRMVAVKN